MGHGDDLIIARHEFSRAVGGAARRCSAELLRIDAPAARVARAVLSLYPLDGFVDDAAARMEIIGGPDEVPEVQREVQAEIDRGRGQGLADDRDRALCVLRAGEARPTR